MIEMTRVLRICIWLCIAIAMGVLESVGEEGKAPRLPGIPGMRVEVFTYERWTIEMNRALRDVLRLSRCAPRVGATNKTRVNVRPGYERQLELFDDALYRMAVLTAVKNDYWKRIEGDSVGSLMGNLVSIAHDRVENPELYTAILKLYGEPVATDLPTVAPKRKRLTGVAENQRSAWEYFLLAPKTARIKFMGSKPLYAIMRISGERSLPVLVAAFRNHISNCGASAIGSVSVLEIATISATKSPRCLEALLECIAIAEAAGPELRQDWRRPMVRPIVLNPKKPEDYETVIVNSYRDLVFFNLSYRGANPTWKAELEKYPAERLSQANRELIEKSIEALQ